MPDSGSSHPLNRLKASLSCVVGDATDNEAEPV